MAQGSEMLDEALECVQVLVAHGYSRAALQEIPIYERVVGGLVFCLQSEELTSVDCDILFRPVATVKERVRVAEAICNSFNTALLAYKKHTNSNTTLTLSVHELQGANYAKLKQVVQWLVKHTQIKLTTRMHSSIQMQWELEAPAAADCLPKITLPPRTISRKSKFKLQTKDISEQERIQRCLLEYGEKTRVVPAVLGRRPSATEATDKGLLHDIAKQAMAAQLRRSSSVQSTPTTEFERQYQQAESEAMADEMKALEEQKELEDRLLQQAMQVQEQSWRQSHVTDLKSLDAAVAVYDATSEEIRSQLSISDPEGFALITERRRLENEVKRWQEKLNAQKINLQNLQAQNDTLGSEVEALQTAQSTACSKKTTLKEKKDKIEQAEYASHQKSSDLATLRELISRHTNLKLEESEFKAKCQEELTQLQKHVQDLSDSQDKRLSKLDEKYKIVAAKRDQLKQELAAEVRGVLSTLRLIDDVPCKIELIQYEKRFMELYDEVALTLEETRKYFSFYNTLETTHEYLEKEVALIDSINANFEIALSSKAATDVFFDQMQQVIANIQTNVAKQQSLCESKQLDIDTLDSKYQLLLEKQQAYVSAIRDFQKECERNEKLQAHLT